jgi:preprotein translocase subunit YajC
MEEPPQRLLFACGAPQNFWLAKRTGNRLQGAEGLIFLALLIGIFYFMLIRPQKKRVEQHRQLIESVGVGDEVVTIGGIYATVVALGDEEIELELSPGTRVRFVKSAIARRVTEDLEEEEDETEHVEDDEE